MLFALILYDVIIKVHRLFSQFRVGTVSGSDSIVETFRKRLLYFEAKSNRDFKRGLETKSMEVFKVRPIVFD